MKFSISYSILRESFKKSPGNDYSYAMGIEPDKGP